MTGMLVTVEVSMLNEITGDGEDIITHIHIVLLHLNALITAIRPLTQNAMGLW